MSAVALLFRGELRRRWPSYLALALLIAFASGSVMAAVAAGRRTVNALPDFLARYGYDDVTYSIQPLPQLQHLPEVASYLPISGYPTGGSIEVNGRVLPGSFVSLIDTPPEPWRVVKLLSGRFPSTSGADEAVISTSMASVLHLRIGSRVRVPLYAPNQAQQLAGSGNGTPPARGPVIQLRVVGTEESWPDLPGENNYTMYVSRGLGHVAGRALRIHLALLRLRHAPAAQSRFAAAMGALSRWSFFESLATYSSGAAGALNAQATGWWLLAALSGLAALAVIGQAFARQALVQSESHRVLRSLGVSPSQVIAAGAVSAASIGAVGALGGVGLAWALSSLTPVGLARTLEPVQGIDFDALVLLVGLAVTILLTVALGVCPVWWRVRAGREWRQAATVSSAPSALSAASLVPSIAGTRARRPSRWSPACALIGRRRALQAGNGQARLPVATAVLGSCFAVAALVATAVFGAGLSRLVATPSLYGRTWQLELSGSLDGNDAARVVPVVLRTPGVERVNSGMRGYLRVGEATTVSVALSDDKGGLLLPVVTGRLPHADDEIALGQQTLRQVGAHLGSVVPVAVAGGRPQPFTVVGTTTFEPGLTSGGLGQGALLTFAGNLRAACGTATGPCATHLRSQLMGVSQWGVLIATQPGPAGSAAVSSISHRFPKFVNPNVTPADLVNFGTAVNFPLLLGVILAALGAGTFAHLLVVTVARRRRDFGLLKALGFVRAQLVATVSWQATTIALVAVAVGVPVGVAAGRIIWHTFAFNLGAVPREVVPAWTVVALGAGVILGANLLALAPALTAMRLRPSVALREP
jgi:hypothetical protein